MPVKRRVKISMPAKVRAKTQYKPRPSTEPAQPDGNDDYGVPTDDEWKLMSPYKSFVVYDADEERYDFTTGQNAIIVPHECDPDSQLSLRDYWVGRIKEIRSRHDDPSEVWVKVQWYWSASDVAEKLYGIDPDLFGKMERLKSNSFDYVHSSCFQFFAEVVSFDESILNQPYIGDETFYYRYNFNIRTNSITPKFPAPCLCKKPYNPRKDKLLHFCPRMTCQKAYHASCLLKAACVEPAQQHASRPYRFERTLPDSAVTQPGSSGLRIKREQTPLPLFLPTAESWKRGRQRKDGIQPKVEEMDIPIIDYSFVPKDLLQLARSPMVRGIEGFGVAGNIRVVAEARRIVNAAIHEEREVSEDWKKTLQECGGKGTDVLTWVAKDINLTCPSCGGAI